MPNVEEGTVCYAGEIVDHTVHGLGEACPDLSVVKMSYRPVTLMFNSIIDNDFKVSIKPFWVFVAIVIDRVGVGYKLVEYIEAEHEEWAREAMLTKVINFYEERKVK
jgi:hypothetical protein